MKVSKILPSIAAILFLSSPFSGGEPISDINSPLKDGRSVEVYSLFSDDVETKVNGLRSYSAAHTTPDLGVTWDGATVWMTGVNWGGEAFNNSIAIGPNFFSSTLGPEDYVPVDIIFSSSTTTLCQTFRRDNSYNPGGVGTFPGAAYDMTDPMNPRRLNICFVEDAGLGTANLTWDPNTNSVGKREYLFIMDSDYDSTGTTYAASNILSGPVDVQYGWWPRVTPGSALLENEPATLSINPYYVKNFYHIPLATTEVNLYWKYFGSGTITKYRVLRDLVNPPVAPFDSLSGFELNDPSLSPATTYYYQIEGLNSTDSLIAKSKILTLEGSVNSSNMNFLGAWHEKSLYGDSWGYVDGANEYALICARNEGVSIIDINSLPYTEVSFLAADVPGTDAKDIKIYKNFAFMVMESAPIEIYDLTNINAPVQVSTITPTGGGTHNIAIYGDYLYAVGHGVGGVEIFDISTPASWFYTGGYSTYYYHDVDFNDNYMLGCGIYGHGIDIIDITDKTSPAYVTTFNYSGSGAHNVAISPDGRFAYIGDEIGSTGNHTRVFDISDVNNISYINDYIVNPAAPVHNCYWKDYFLYISHYSEGLRVWNVVNPNTATEVAHFDTYPGSTNGYVGNWNVYPYLPSGKIILSDMQTGLYVVELDPSILDNCFIQDPGDVDSDGDLSDVDDYSLLYEYLYNDGPAPFLLANADVNGDCEINIGDLIHIDNALTPAVCTCSEPVHDCCYGIRGNHNYDPNDDTDITDLTFFVKYFFKGGSAPPCLEESDVNGDSELNIADLTYFVKYIFKGGFAPNNCN